MPVASIARPIAPPRASISRTICPLATPPMAGLQLIWPTVSQLVVSKPGARRQPRGRQRRLGAGMPGADDQHVEVVVGGPSQSGRKWQMQATAH